jgi:acyl-CoA thioesterase
MVARIPEANRSALPKHFSASQSEGEQIQGCKENGEKELSMKISSDREKEIAQHFQSNHFSTLLGMKIDRVEPGIARLSVEVRQELLQLAGVMHGGAIASLIDTAVAIAIQGSSPNQIRFTTVEMKVNYLSPIREGRAVAEARLIRDGRRIIVADCDVWDSEGRLAAKGLVTYIRLNDQNPSQKAE